MFLKEGKKKKKASAARNVIGLNTAKLQRFLLTKRMMPLNVLVVHLTFFKGQVWDSCFSKPFGQCVQICLVRVGRKITSELKQLQSNPSRKKDMPENLCTKTLTRERKGCLLRQGEWACEYLCAQLQDHLTITRCRKQKLNTLCKNKGGHERYAPLKDMHPTLRIKLLLHLYSQSIFSKRYSADNSYTSSAATVLWHDSLETSSKACPVLPSQHWIYPMQIRCKKPGLPEHHFNNSSTLECSHIC